MKNKTEDILHSLPSHKLLFIEIALFAIMVIIILSILLDDNLAAKYTSSESGSNTGRVAAWSVNVTDAQGSTEWSSGKTIAYDETSKTGTFTFVASSPDASTTPIKFNETACNYSVRLVVPSGKKIPTDMSLYLTDKIYTQQSPLYATYDESKNTYTFKSDSLNFEPVEIQNDTIVLHFEWTATETPAFGNINGIEVWVDFVQID